MWAVVHINAAELVSTCQLSTTLSIHGLTAYPGQEVEPRCLHLQQKLSCGGAVPCCVPLCPGTADLARCSICAWLCPFLSHLLGGFSIQSKAGDICSHKGLWTLAHACPTGNADGGDIKPALFQPLSRFRVSFPPGSLFPILAWINMVALDREEWRCCGHGNLAIPTFIYQSRCTQCVWFIATR